MSVTLHQFLESLDTSGLISKDDSRVFLDGLPVHEKPDDAATLARKLVAANRLTKYQAQTLYAGKTGGLVYGEYVVLDKIGTGGMGLVYKAQHRRMQRIVALKLLPARATGSPDSLKRFEREIQAAARLEHPNIVTAHDAGEVDGIHYLVMQYIDGCDLRSIIREDAGVPMDTAIGYILQTARGLEYAHSQGIIHRDIKPANLLVTNDGTVKILDMGLALIHEGESDANKGERLTVQGQILGTANYMAPEQAEDTHLADARSDIYSLGATLYHLITGQPPFSGETVTHVLLAHLDAPRPSMRDIVRETPELLDDVFQKMMAISPDDRFQTMGELIAALEPCQALGESIELTAARAATSAATNAGDETIVSYGGNDSPPPQFESAASQPHDDVSVSSSTTDTIACDAISDTQSTVKPIAAKPEPKSSARLLIALGGVAILTTLAVACYQFLLR